MSKDEDEIFAAKKPPSQHVLGEPLDALSVDELDERVQMLRAEIERLEAARAHKSASRSAADAFFKK